MLTRDIALLNQGAFDVVVIGGGIFGACAAREAALAGLSVALIEQKDFSHATSANHFKMVHCGIRYLQHLDIKRLWESSYERSALLRIAPHLVQTVPIVIPTYGVGSQGKPFLGVGMLTYDLLTIRRNEKILPDKRIAPTQFFSRSKLLSFFPGLNKAGLTGGMVFDEGQMYNLPRLALAFIHSAAERGAVVANYVRATDFLTSNGKIIGVKSVDETTGESFEVQSRYVLNTAGPWAHRLLNTDKSIALKPVPTFSRDLAFTLPRRFDHRYGVALPSETRDADVLADRGGRHLFAVPWRTCTLIGVWHKVFEGPPEEVNVEPEELEQFRREVAHAYPGLCDDLDQIQVINTGLTLFGDAHDQRQRGLSFGKRSMLVDHKAVHGRAGLVTLIGVRATTARGMASKAIGLILRKLNKPFTSKKASAYQPVWGGGVASFSQINEEIQAFDPVRLSTQVVRSLAHNYGSKTDKILGYVRQNRNWAMPLQGSTTLPAEVVHSVREEMALTLGDVVFRRTDLGTGGKPTKAALTICADIMATELGWSKTKMEHELELVNQSYPRLG